MSITSIKQKIELLVRSFKDKVSDGKLSWKEFQLLVGEFTAAVMAIVEAAGLPGPQKKQIVLDGVGLLCDALLPLIPTYGLGWFIRPYLKSAALTGASFLIEKIWADHFK